MEVSTIALNALFSIIPQIAMVAICIRYYRLARSKNSIYFLFGVIFSLLRIIYAPFSVYLTVKMEISAIQAGIIGGIVNFIGLLGAFFFAFAFRSLIKKLLTAPEKSNDDIINEIGQF